MVADIQEGDLAEDTQEAVDTPSPHQAAATSAVAAASPRRHAETTAGISIVPARSLIAETSIAGSMAVAVIMAVAGITAAGDITAQDLDSVSASIRHTDMRLRYVILRGSMISMGTGRSIPVAQCLTGIES